MVVSGPLEILPGFYVVILKGEVTAFILDDKDCVFDLNLMEYCLSNGMEEGKVSRLHEKMSNLCLRPLNCRQQFK